MVFFNYATMQMAAKIVYYGPGLCGKTTNLHQIYSKTSPQSRGEMVSLETETDRTLFFDLLPIDVGVIGGFKTRLQLYTIPGQVFYNTTRKLVLKGVDGLVFVADSQLAMFDANLDSFRNLRENLAEIGLDLDDIPLVLQMNKRDLPNVATVESVQKALDPDGKYESVEAVAASGVGVFETLKVISKLTLRTLRRRMTGEDPVKPAPRRGLADVAQFRVKDEARAGGASSSASAVASTPGVAPFNEAEMEEISRSVDVAVEEMPADGPAAPKRKPRTTSAAPQPKPAETDIDFSELERPKAPAMKTVKVRSTIDVMAELEALRKKATQGTSKSKKETAVAPPTTGRELQKALNLQVPAETLSRARTMKVTVSFENGEDVVGEQSESVELGDTSDLQAIAVKLRIDQS